MTRIFSRSSKDSRQREEDLETIAAQEQKQFAFETLVAATQDFNPKSKLGQGGFGPVFKGRLEDGREIAVKMLSRSSNQGKKEFTNEARLLAKVQHRNVVNLLGYCVHGSENLLVYEYIVNQSIDKILFNADVDKRKDFNWKRRYDVILGVARGLLYLHEDSHSVIIHRDIKASNILLDDKWTPKIADFGMARLYPEDQTHVNTRVAGTNGYMAPEYVMHGQLSVKADVFSYGVLVLELISGKKNSTFSMEPDVQSLLEWAWKLYTRGRRLELMDPVLESTAVTDQVAMCIQIGLLCTQADPRLRPTMQQVVVMLSRKPENLKEPTRPGYPGSRYRRTRITGGGASSSSGEFTTHPESSSRAASTSASASASASATNSNTATTSTHTRSTPPRSTHRRSRPPSYEKRPMQT